MKTVLTIAGSDCSGGAGIQADIKTITAHGLYAMSAVTALTAQNTTGVYAVEAVSPDFLRRQLACIFDDIVPDAVKVGMLANAELMETAADCLVQYQAQNIVIDPVMTSTSGKELFDEGGGEFTASRLFRLAAVITPNIPEAEQLSGRKIQNTEDMEAAAACIFERMGGNTAVLVKGGHQTDTADDLLYLGDCHGKRPAEEPVYEWLLGARIDNPNTHGTGCTLSSAIAVYLAKGCSLRESVKCAKKYITGAIAAGLNLGRGSGPLNHMYCIKQECPNG